VEELAHTIEMILIGALIGGTLTALWYLAKGDL
jgi:hypothetical protein